jgi:protein TonB
MTVWEEYQGNGSARWLLPLLLSVVLHLVLLQLLIQVRESLPPRIAGSTQLTVLLTGSAQPATAPTATVPESGPPAVLPEAPVPIEEPASMQGKTISPVPRLVPGKMKIILPAEVADDQPFSSLPPTAAGANPALVPGKGGDGADGPEIGAGVPAAASATLREAVPLAGDNRPPEYPALARKRGWEGKVLLEVVVGCDGTVQTVRVQSGSSHDLLDEAALRAVREWRFQPGTRNGEPEAMQVLVPVNFMLQSNS